MFILDACCTCSFLLDSSTLESISLPTLVLQMLDFLDFFTFGFVLGYATDVEDFALIGGGGGGGSDGGVAALSRPSCEFASFVDGVSLVVLLELLMLLDTPLLVDESDMDAVALLIKLLVDGVAVAVVMLVAAKIELGKAFTTPFLLFETSDPFE
jgi:hypothetical protein